MITDHNWQDHGGRREGARRKGLQKSNLCYRGRLMTPRNHPHTSTDNERPGICDFARAHMVLHSTMVSYVVLSYGYNTEKTTFLRRDKNCVHLCSPNRKHN